MVFVLILGHFRAFRFLLHRKKEYLKIGAPGGSVSEASALAKVVIPGSWDRALRLAGYLLEIFSVCLPPTKDYVAWPRVIQGGWVLAEVMAEG